MPVVNVRIKWDEPEDKNWLNVYNLKMALEDHCKNTKFQVEDLDPPYNSSDLQPRKEVNQ